MTNLEWLEKMKKDKIDQDYFEYRKVKALEIIAEALLYIKDDTNCDLLELKKKYFPKEV